MGLSQPNQCMANSYEDTSIWFALLKLCDALTFLMLLLFMKVQNIPKCCSMWDVLYSRPALLFSDCCEPKFCMVPHNLVPPRMQIAFICNECVKQVITSEAWHWWCYGCSKMVISRVSKDPNASVPHMQRLKMHGLCGVLKALMASTSLRGCL